MSSPWSCGSDPNSIWNSNSPNLNLLRRYSLRSPACTSGATANDSNNNALSTTAAAATTTNHHRHLSCGPQTLLSPSSPSANVAAGAGGGGVVVIGSSGSIHIQSTTTTLSPAAAAVASAVGHTQLTNSSKSKCSWEPSVDNKYLIGYIVVGRQDLEVYHSSLGIQVCGGKPTHDGQFGAIVEHVVPGSLMNIVCKLKVGDEIVEWNGHDLRNKPKEEVKQIIESTTKTAAINCFLGTNTSHHHSGSGMGGSCVSNIIGNHQQPLSLNSITQLRLVAVRLVNNNNGGTGNSGSSSNNSGNSGGSSSNCNGSGNNNNNTNNNNSSGSNNNSGGGAGNASSTVM